MVSICRNHMGFYENRKPLATNRISAFTTKYEKHLADIGVPAIRPYDSDVSDVTSVKFCFGG